MVICVYLRSWTRLNQLDSNPVGCKGNKLLTEVLCLPSIELYGHLFLFYSQHAVSSLNIHRIILDF